MVDIFFKKIAYDNSFREPMRTKSDIIRMDKHSKNININDNDKKCHYYGTNG